MAKFFKFLLDSGYKFQVATEIFAQIHPELKLLIYEDANQLKNAFQCQQELSQVILVNSKLSFTKKTAILSILIAIISLASQNLHVILTTLFSSILALAYLYFPIYCKNAFQKTTCKLAYQIRQEKKLYTKLFQTIEDNSILSQSSNSDHQKRFEEIKIGIRDIGLSCLLEFRELTLQLISRFPLKADVDQDLVCLLPDDLFDSYKQDDTLNIKALKSLLQLQRLQISEFFKRLLLLFVENYQDTEQFKKNVFVTLKSSAIIPLLANSTSRCANLQSILYFYKSFYEPTEFGNDLVAANNKTGHLWSTCRLIRKNLYASLSILDELEKLCENDDLLNSEEKGMFQSIVQTLQREIDSTNDTVTTITKLLKHQEPKIVEVKSVDSCEQSARPVVCPEDITKIEVPLKDEVFVADTSEFDNDDDGYQAEKGDTLFDELLNSTETSPVYHELRHALKNKAVEHKIREATVLGLKVDEETLKQEYEKSLKEEPSKVNHGTMKANVIAADQSSPFQIQFNFDLDVKNKLFNLKEDTFEYSDTGSEESE